MKVEGTFTESILGSANADPNIHRDQVAKNASDAEKIAEEMASLTTDELERKTTSVFARDDDGTPILWDYQIVGFFKECLGMYADIFPEVRIGKTKLTKFTHKRIAGNYIHVLPRKIRLCAPVGLCVRPLRGEVMGIERTCLAASEEVQAGTRFQFEVVTDFKQLDEIILWCLDRGKLKGLGQWRGSGHGRFEWAEVK